MTNLVIRRKLIDCDDIYLVQTMLKYNKLYILYPEIAMGAV